MFKILLATVLFVSQVFGQERVETQDPINKATKDKITYLEADLKFNKSLLEYQLKKLAIYQEYMDKGTEPVYIDSRNAIAISFAASLLTLSGVIKSVEYFDKKKMTSEQLAKYKEWYKTNQVGSVKSAIVLIGSMLMVVPAAGLLVDEYRISYTRGLAQMSGESLRNEHNELVSAIIKYSEAIQSAQAQLGKLK